MKLLIGLGNPGRQYKNTRHNVGFLALDFLQKKLSAPKFKKNKKLAAEIAEANIEKEKIILAKPLTFMNNSGKAVFAISQFYKIAPEDIMVIHDDMDIPFGEIKKAHNRGSAGHNGVQSIINLLGTKKFARLRIGIGKPETIPVESYVLQRFNKEELKKINKIFEKIKIDMD